MKQEVIFMGMGILVVLVMMLIMILAIELIVKYDEWLRLRGQKKELAPVATEEVPLSSSAEVIAAISLALHEYFSHTNSTVPLLQKGPEEGSKAWALSGRLELMSSRSRLTGRGR